MLCMDARTLLHEPIPAKQHQTEVAWQLAGSLLTLLVRRMATIVMKDSAEQWPMCGYGEWDPE
jgi:hypothetical protein